MSFNKGAYFKCIQEECQRLGYHWHEDIVKVINTADYGVPQIRKRMFIVGSRVGKLFRWPRATYENRPVTLRDAIDDLPIVQAPSLEERLPYESERIRSDYQRPDALSCSGYGKTIYL